MPGSVLGMPFFEVREAVWTECNGLEHGSNEGLLARPKSSRDANLNSILVATCLKAATYQLTRSSRNKLHAR